MCSKANLYKDSYMTITAHCNLILNIKDEKHLDFDLGLTSALMFLKYFVP